MIGDERREICSIMAGYITLPSKQSRLVSLFTRSANGRVFVRILPPSADLGLIALLEVK